MVPPPPPPNSIPPCSLPGDGMAGKCVLTPSGADGFVWGGRASRDIPSFHRFSLIGGCFCRHLRGKLGKSFRRNITWNCTCRGHYLVCHPGPYLAAHCMIVMQWHNGLPGAEESPYSGCVGSGGREERESHARVSMLRVPGPLGRFTIRVAFPTLPPRGRGQGEEQWIPNNHFPGSG